MASNSISDRDRKNALSSLFDVSGIPTFVMLDEDLNVINKGARQNVSSDPEGESFPWKPKAVNDFTTDGPGSINETTSVIVMANEFEPSVKAMVTKSLLPLAEKFIEEAKAKGEDSKFAFFTGENKAIGSQVLKMCKVEASTIQEEKVQLLIMDIPDNGGYYVGTQVDINGVKTAVETLINAYNAKALKRQQLG